MHATPSQIHLPHVRWGRQARQSATYRASDARVSMIKLAALPHISPMETMKSREGREENGIRFAFGCFLPSQININHLLAPRRCRSWGQGEKVGGGRVVLAETEDISTKTMLSS
jgi:hypothetical protein